MEPRTRPWRWLPPLLLALLTLWAFLPVAENGFVGFDDDPYVVENPAVRAGLTREGVAWAFDLRGHASNWHPLAWLSHMLDVELFGLDAGAHHLVSLALHVASSLALFALLRGLTGAAWRSLLAAALFAVHPLHVESVAWVAERKDVLSTLLGLLAAAAWLRHARTGAARHLALATVVFAAALLAKPMLVTLPFVLLLLDFWPLGRLGPAAVDPATGRRGAWPWRSFAEKLPLLLLAAAVSAVTLAVQHAGVAPLDALPVGARLANAAGATWAYLAKAAWPLGLAVFYPFPALPLPAAAIAVLGGLLLAICAAVLAAARRQPHLAVGWFWYLGTLVPVVGLVQVGRQAMADRYTYLPLTGIFLALAWSAPALHAASRRRRALTAAVALAAIAALAGLTRAQARHWRDMTTLFEHSLAVTGENLLARSNLNSLLFAAGRYDEAAASLRRSLRADPASAMTKVNLAGALYQRGALDEAIALYRQAAAEAPGYPEVHNNFGCALFAKGAVDEAVAAWREAVRLNPAYANAHFNLGQVCESRGAREEARAHYRGALRSSPHHDGARRGLERLR